MNLHKFFNGIGILAAVLLSVCLVAILGLGAVYLVKILLVAVLS